MPVRRSLAAAALAMTPLLFTTLVAQPAQAHGAMDNPISRAVACGPEGGADRQSPACKAAATASGGAAAFDSWDNLRVANVNGRDQQRIPDGKLCSGGLDQFKGLDLARSDWPATRLTAAAAFTFEYRVTIPHTGSFRLYVTKNGYDPTRPLRWSDLESKPFLTATDPKVQGGSYVMRGALPPGKAGRHLIYTIWQTTSTPDTYYSCSDVDFGGKPAAPAPATTAAAAQPSAGGSPTAQQQASPDGSPVPVSAVSHTSGMLPLVLVAVLLAVAAAAALVVAFLRRRRA
jgi:chitin-binding protein